MSDWQLSPAEVFESMAEFVHNEDRDHFTSVSGCTITMVRENPGRFKILCPRCGWTIEKDDIQQLALGEIKHLSECKKR
jgi:hypothetical protein